MRIVFQGDSITDAGRDRRNYHHMGSGYPKYAAALIREAFPDADIEIIEKHHSAKLDSPSGTALMLAQAIKSVRESLTLMLGRNGRRVREKNEVGIHAVRAGSIVGEHEVIIATEHEIITVSHAA